MLKYLFIVLLALNLFSGVHAATTYYYVDPINGNDNNGGTSTSDAFKTLGKLYRIGDNSPNTDKILQGVNFTAADPCVIYLMDGTHLTNVNEDKESILVEGQYVTFKNYPGHSPRVYVPWTETYTEWTATAFRVFGYSDGGISTHHITIDGLEIEGGVSYALKVDEWTSDVVIRNCTIHGSGLDGCKFVGESAAGGGNSKNSGMIFEYNEVYDTGKRIVDEAEGIDAMAVSNMVVRHNYFHDIPTSGLYFKGNSENITIENNFFVRTGWLAHTDENYDDAYGAIWLGECSDQYFIPADPNDYECINCDASNNVMSGIGGSAVRMMGCSGCDVTGNTIYNSERPHNWWYDWMDYGSLHVVIGCPHDVPRETNANVSFTYNLVIDTQKQTYNQNTQNPIFGIGSGAWDAGDTTLSEMTADYNLYYRADGDYLFWDQTESDSETTLAAWKAASGLEENSTVSADGSNLLPIQTTPTLDESDLDNYLLGSAVPANVGADISLILYPFDNDPPPASSNIDFSTGTGSFSAGTGTLTNN